MQTVFSFTEHWAFAKFYPGCSFSEALVQCLGLGIKHCVIVLATSEGVLLSPLFDVRLCTVSMLMILCSSRSSPDTVAFNVAFWAFYSQHLYSLNRICTAYTPLKHITHLFVTLQQFPFYMADHSKQAEDQMQWTFFLPTVLLSN